MCVRRKNEGGPRDRGPFPSCHRVARFLNSQFLGIFVPRRFWIRGGWKERKIFTTLSLFITSLDETNSIPIRKQYSKFSIIVTAYRRVG